MKIVIFGLGRIGLPIALVCTDSGYKVTGIDINKRLINSLKNKKLPFYEPGMKDLLLKHINKNFFPKHQENNIEPDLKEAEYIILAVGTSFAKYPEKPKLDTLHSIINQITKINLKGKTIILRVTLPIGTSDNAKKLIEEKTNLKEGKDFWFAFVPERIMEGKAIKEEKNLPKIIGTYNDEAYKKVSNFFKKIGGKLVKVSNPRTAEFIKLIDNSWRNTRFAFANELSFLAEKNNIDVLEAIESANKGYKRNEIPIPGPVSGYCLGKDPYLLELAFEEISKKRGFNSVWCYGRQANDWLNQKIIEEVKGKNILVAGLSFKQDIDDYRYSHSIEIVQKLVEKGYNVYVHDPYLDSNYYTTLPKKLEKKVKKTKNINEIIKKIDTIIIATRHKEYKNLDIKTIKPTTKIMDLWNIYRKTPKTIKK